MLNRLSIWASLSAVLCCALSVTTQADIVNVNYDNSTNVMDGTSYVDNTTSMVSYTGSSWNEITSTNTTSGFLDNSDGIATTITAQTSGFIGIANNGNGAVPILSESYAYVRDNAGTLTIAGLDPTLTYDLHLAGQGDQFNQNATFTLNSVVQSPNLLTTWPSSYGSGPGDLWVSYLGITGQTSLAITVDHSTARWGGLNGFQLVSTPVAVPEPSSIVLLGLGSFAFLTRRRR